MKFLIIGLGSMGKRRIRNLQYLKIKNIIGFDPRLDRREEAENKYGIATVDDLKKVNIGDLDAIIISTPPDTHNVHMAFAIKHSKPAFVEASVVLGNLEKLDKDAIKKKVLIAPSCTSRFHSSIRTIKELVQGGKYGKVTNFSYHCGLYLPDWHPWEKVTDYYVSKKETGAAREIVPFELTWLWDIVGIPKKVMAYRASTMDVGAPIDDTYAIAMNFGNMLGTMVIDVVSRYGIRSLLLNMEHGQIMWRWDENFVKLYYSRHKRWTKLRQSQGKSARGYNKNISEDMYVDEMRAFISATKGKRKFPNTLKDDIVILKSLIAMEKTK